MIIQRRSFLLGLGAALAGPAVVRAESIMRVSPPPIIRSPTMAPGMLIGFTGPTPGVSVCGLIPCDGRELSRAKFPDLYRVIGNAYGYGTRPGSFNVPDMRGRTVVGASDPMLGLHYAIQA